MYAWVPFILRECVFISLILRQYVALYFAANPQLLQRPSRAAMVAAMPFFDQIADEE